MRNVLAAARLKTVGEVDEANETLPIFQNPGPGSVTRLREALGVGLFRPAREVERLRIAKNYRRICVAKTHGCSNTAQVVR